MSSKLLLKVDITKRNCGKICENDKNNVPLQAEKHYNNMKTFLKYLGALLVLCGVICLAVYYFAVPTNGLLVASLALEVVGILAYILINKYID